MKIAITKKQKSWRGIGRNFSCNGPTMKLKIIPTLSSRANGRLEASKVNESSSKGCQQPLSYSKVKEQISPNVQWSTILHN